MFFYSESDSGASGGAVALPTSWSEIEQIENSSSGEDFGFGVAINDNKDLMVVGCPQYSSGGGAVKIFEFQGGQWNNTGIITKSAGRFGQDVALSADGNMLAASAAYESHSGKSAAGAVYVYERINGAWQQTSRIQAGDVGEVDLFGYGVSLSKDGTHLAAGSILEDQAGTNAGAVYIFQNQGTSWSQTTKLTATGSDITNDFFGASVSLNENGTLLAVGATEDNNAVGSVYIFENQNGTWTQTTQLLGPGTSRVYFGSGVSLTADGSLLAIGARFATPDNLWDAGFVHIYKNENGTWTQISEITASDKEVSDHFGVSVSFTSDGSLLAIGASGQDLPGNSNVGSIYTFQGT